MHTTSPARRIYVAGDAIDVWEDPQAPFGWTPAALQCYVQHARWEHLFNALVLLGDAAPRGGA